MKSLTLVFLLSCVSCTTANIPDFRMDLVLPASGDCYGKYVVSKQVERIPADHPLCIERKMKALSIAPDQYAIIKKSFYKNCMSSDCKQTIQGIDGLFDTLSKAVDSYMTKSK